MSVLPVLFIVSIQHCGFCTRYLRIHHQLVCILATDYLSVRRVVVIPSDSELIRFDLGESAWAGPSLCKSFCSY